MRVCCTIPQLPYKRESHVRDWNPTQIQPTPFLLTDTLGEISCRSLVWVQWYAVKEEVWEEVWEEVCAFISVWVYTHL